MYHFGYYYHFSSKFQKYKEVVLLMQNGLFKFKEVASDLIPFNKRSMTSAYYDLSMPVICRYEGNSVTEVVFLYDIPVTGNQRNDGFSYDIDITNKHSILYYRSKTVVDNFIADEKEKIFAHLIEELVGANKRISVLNGIISFITPDKYRRTKEVIARDLKKIVESFNMEEILSSLNVVVTDFYRSKIGGDDSYRINRSAWLSDKSAKTDEYINKVIGIGEECIHSDSGYTSNLRAYAPDVYIGEYKGEELEKEKQSIISKYSREEHMAYLIFSKLEEKESAIIEREEWKESINELKKSLESEFSLSKILEIDKRLFYSDYNNTLSELLDKINALISRKMSNSPRKRVIFSGPVPKEYGIGWWDNVAKNRTIRTQLLDKISSIIENLLKDYNVEIISGNAEGAEHESLQYALKHKLEFVNEYTTWTMLGKDREIVRYKEMAKMADIIYLTDFEDSYLYKNFLQVANELSIPVEIIKCEVDGNFEY